MKRILVVILFVAGVSLILFAPYIPDQLYEIIRSFETGIYDTRYMDIRYFQLIPSVRTCGIIVSIWGIGLLIKEEKK